MDSGAYSAETKGAKISVAEYARFLKQNAKYISVAANLDVLFNPEATWINQQQLEQSAGMTILPTFHFGEDFKWLVRYAAQYDYIALGGQVGQSPEQLMLWLDEVWDHYLTDVAGQPIVKVHGFGVTSLPVMRRYPWYSVDSTSWLLSASMGKIMVFHQGDLITIPVSDTSPFLDKRNQHLDTLTPETREALVQILKINYVDIAEAQKSYYYREVVNATAFMHVAASIKHHPFQREQIQMFAEPFAKADSLRCRRPVQWDHLCMYLAGNPAKGITDEVMRKGYNRLMSYHYIEQGQMWSEAKTVLDNWSITK